MFTQRTRAKAAKARDRLIKTLNFPHLKKTQPNSPQDSIQVLAHQSTTPPGSPLVMTGLRVSVTARFESPIDKNFYHSYEASPTLEITDELRNTLLSRIEHCAYELVTRPDPKAAEPLRHPQTTEPQPKIARYHLIFRIDHQGRPWAERHFTSFQQQRLDLHAAHEVVLEADRIVNLFFLAHDIDYVERLPSVVKEDPLEHKTANPEVGAPQSIQCIPTYRNRSGYTISLTLRTAGKGRNRTWAGKVDSQQATPLTLHLGEDLMSKVTAIVQRAVKQRENRFVEIHEHCDALQGTFGCQHFEESAFDMILKLQNNFGPDYPHFSTRIQSFRHLVGQGQGTAFVQDLERQIQEARDHFDEVIDETDDLVLTVHELRSKDWRVDQPLAMVLDSSVLNSRITTERVLERVQVGMADVLRGHGTAAVLTAHKRGHLVLETTICFGADTSDFYDLKLFSSIGAKKIELQKRLRERIQADFAMVMKDTIALEDPRPVPQLNVTSPEHAAIQPLTPGARAVAAEEHETPEQRLSRRLPLFDIRRRSLQAAEAEAAEPEPEPQGQLAADYGYMADMVSRKSESLHEGLPSLADTASINLRDGAMTPPSTRAVSQSMKTPGLGIMDFGSSGQNDAHEDEPKGYVEGSTAGTILHHPQPTSRVANSLLAGYWDPASSDASGLDKSGASILRDCREDPDIWRKKQATDNEAPNGTKGSPGSDTMDESTWLGTKLPTYQIPSKGKKTWTEMMRDEPDVGSGGSNTNQGQKARKKSVHFLPHQLSMSHRGPTDNHKYKATEASAHFMQHEPGMGSHISAAHNEYKGTEASGKLDQEGFSIAAVKQPLGIPSSHASSETQKGVDKTTKLPPDNPQEGIQKRSSALLLRDFDQPFGISPRSTSGQTTHSQSLGHAEGLFHRRSVSSSPGGHLGLYGDSVIDMGLRNALLPAHLRSSRTEPRLVGSLNSDINTNTGTDNDNDKGNN